MCSQLREMRDNKIGKTNFVQDKKKNIFGINKIRNQKFDKRKKYLNPGLKRILFHKVTIFFRIIFQIVHCAFSCRKCAIIKLKKKVEFRIKKDSLCDKQIHKRKMFSLRLKMHNQMFDKRKTKSESRIKKNSLSQS